MWAKQPKNPQQRGSFFALLVALVLFMGLFPLFETGQRESLVVRVGFTLVLIVGAGVAWESRKLLGFALVLLGLSLVAHWLVPLITGDESTVQLVRHASGAIYLFYLILLLARTLARQRQPSLDAILGGINIYLLLALAFMELHLFLEELQPGSYVSGGLALSDPASHPHGSLRATLFYFSFTTLTTLGYGDIAPARPMSQILCSAEAVIGQLFVAIFIGGLVALWISDLAQKGPEEPD